MCKVAHLSDLGQNIDQYAFEIVKSVKLSREKAEAKIEENSNGLDELKGNLKEVGIVANSKISSLNKGVDKLRKRLDSEKEENMSRRETISEAKEQIEKLYYNFKDQCDLYTKLRSKLLFYHLGTVNLQVKSISDIVKCTKMPSENDKNNLYSNLSTKLSEMREMNKNIVQIFANSQKNYAETTKKLNQEIRDYNSCFKMNNEQLAKYSKLFKQQEIQKIKKFIVDTEISKTNGTSLF